jgi:MinD-like ATPase involved in chromosome partitioning or flagellar assembly
MLSVLVAVGAAAWESDFVAALEHQRGLQVVRRCVDVTDLLAAASSGRAQAALVSTSLSGLDAEAVVRLADQGVEVVGVVTGGSSSQTSRLRNLNIKVLVDAEIPEAISPALTEVAAGVGHHRGDPASHVRGPDDTLVHTERPQGGDIVAVWGPGGGAGRSTVALGLASELSTQGVSTLLVDADVYGGSLASMLAMLDESSGILAAARSANNGNLDISTLARQAREVTPLLRVLTGLPRADRWPQLRPSALSVLLGQARAIAAFIVVDVGFSLEQDEELSLDTSAPRRNGATLLVLEEAERVLAVGSADTIGLTRLTRGVVDLREAVPGVGVEVVVNRMRPSLGWSEEEVRETVARFTGVDTIRFLPEDRPACDRALVEGRTLAEVAPDSGLRSALGGLAAELAGLPPADRRRGRLRRMLTGSSA